MAPMGLDLRELLHLVCLGGELAAVLIMYSIYRLVRRSNAANHESNLRVVAEMRRINEEATWAAKDLRPKPPAPPYVGQGRSRFGSGRGQA